MCREHSSFHRPHRKLCTSRKAPYTYVYTNIHVYININISCRYKFVAIYMIYTYKTSLLSFLAAGLLVVSSPIHPSTLHVTRVKKARIWRSVSWEIKNLSSISNISVEECRFWRFFCHCFSELLWMYSAVRDKPLSLTHVVENVLFPFTQKKWLWINSSMTNFIKTF